MAKKAKAESRLKDSVTTQEAGCHGCDKKWNAANANQMAALHHDKTGHKTWCKIVMEISYGADAPAEASKDALADPDEKKGVALSEKVGFRCSQCGRDQGAHERDKTVQCFKCGGPCYAFVAAAPSEWREPMSDADLILGAPKPVEPEQSIEEFLNEKATTPRFGPQGPATGPPKSIEELIEDRVNRDKKPVEAGPKFEF